jgi:phytoene dehydrogenase-like protein
VQTQSPVQRVLLSGDRATGVELASGEQFVARRAVIANVTPTILFEQLLASSQLPEAGQRHVRQYSYGPGTMMIHLALKEQPRQAAITCGKTFSGVLFPDGRPIACLLSICIWLVRPHGPAPGLMPLRATWPRNCYSTRTRYVIVFWQVACSQGLL